MFRLIFRNNNVFLLSQKGSVIFLSGSKKESQEKKTDFPCLKTQNKINKLQNLTKKRTF